MPPQLLAGFDMVHCDSERIGRQHVNGLQRDMLKNEGMCFNVHNRWLVCMDSISIQWYHSLDHSKKSHYFSFYLPNNSG